jgi:hypothetical protein
MVCGITGLVLLVYFKTTVMQLSVDSKISVTNLYNAIFDWTAIQTGCLFGIYGFVAGKNDGFIGEIRNTRSMKRYGVYIRRAMYIGFVLTLTSIPLIVTNYKIEKDDHLLYYIVAVWFSLFLWAFCSFARVAYIFGILIRVNEPAQIPAG